MTRWLHRLGGTAAAHPWRTAGVWLAVLVVESRLRVEGVHGHHGHSRFGVEVGGGQQVLGVEAEDGADAVAKLDTNPIRFVITDWNMPNLNGLELTQYIRQHPRYGHLPILMITTRGMKEDVVAAMQARVNNYVVKPFTPDVLQEKIDAILRRLQAA